MISAPGGGKSSAVIPHAGKWLGMGTGGARGGLEHNFTLPAAAWCGMIRRRMPYRVKT